jgi:hypothetical protein
MSSYEYKCRRAAIEREMNILSSMSEYKFIPKLVGVIYGKDKLPEYLILN